VCYCWVSLPAACRNAQSIGMAVVLNCHSVRPLHPFLPLFIFKVLFLFFLSPCQLSLPRPPMCGVGEKRPWVVQDEIDMGKELWSSTKNDGMPPRPKLPGAVAYRGCVVREYGEGGGATVDGGQSPDNLIAHPPPASTGATRYTKIHTKAKVGGWLGTAFVPDHQGASAHPAFLLSPDRTPRSVSLILSASYSPDLVRTSGYLFPFLCSSSQTRTSRSHPLTLVVPSTRDRQADLCCIMHS